MGRCIQEQSWPHGCGSNLRGAKEKRHRVPNVRAGDAVTYTYTSACRRAHAWQPRLLKFLCQNYLVWLRSQVTCCLMMFVITFSVVSSQPLLRRVTLPYTSTAALLSPHNTLCHQSTPPLKSPTFMPPEPLIPHPNRYSGNPMTTFSTTVLQNNDILRFSF